jgi:BatD DUF11 like domain
MAVSRTGLSVRDRRERPRVSDLARLAVFGLLLVVSSAPAGAAVKAWLDTNRVAPGNSVQLTLEYEGETDTSPDLSPLRQSFDVLGTSRATTVQILNGSTSSKTEVVVSLSPKRAGRLTVPSIAWNADRTAPLRLDVAASAGNGSAAAGTSSAQQVFLETQFGPFDPYVQAAVKVTVRLFTREALYNPHITLAGDSDFLVRQVGRDEQSTAVRGGASYVEVTRHYVVFALRSGRLTLPGAVLDARIATRRSSPFGGNPFAGFFSSTPFFGNVFSTVKPIRLHGQSIRLDVRARPAGAVGSFWLPASAMRLTARWNPAPLKAQAGNPLTVDLSLEATGLTAAQLPDLSQWIEPPAGVRSYPDQPRLTDTAHGDTVTGTREQTIALIADRPGRYTLPSLRVDWWDTRTDRPRETALPARTLVIVPAPGARPARRSSVTTAAQPLSAAAAPAQKAASASAVSGGHESPPPASSASPGRGLLAYHRIWIALIAVLALAWLGTLAAWLRLRRRIARQERVAARATGSAQGAALPSAAASRTALRRACQLDEPAAARRHLLAWAAAAWPGEPPRGLNALARRVDDPETAALIRELDRACYAGEPWTGAPLEEALSELPRPARAQRRGRSADLASLYP